MNDDPGHLIAGHFVPRPRQDILRYILEAILTIVGIWPDLLLKT